MSKPANPENPPEAAVRSLLRRLRAQRLVRSLANQEVNHRGVCLRLQTGQEWSCPASELRSLTVVHGVVLFAQTADGRVRFIQAGESFEVERPNFSDAHCRIEATTPSVVMLQPRDSQP